MRSPPVGKRARWHETCKVLPKIIHFEGGPMKHFFWTTFFASLFTTSAFADGKYLHCEFKISENEVDCPVIGSCPQEILKSSKTNLRLEFNNAGVKKGVIRMKKVVIDPGTDDEDDNDITIFASSKVDESVKAKDVKLISFDASDKIEYKATYYGDEAVSVRFDTSTNFLVMNLAGNVSRPTFILSKDKAIAINCKLSGKEVLDSELSEKAARLKFAQEEAKAKATKE